MLNSLSPFFTDYSIDFPTIEYNLEDTSSFSLMNNISNNVPNSFYLNESEKIDSLIFIQPKIINKRKICFKTELLKQKRGKKRNKESKKAEHTSSNIDNIIVKVQAYFINFIISFLNDCVLNYYKNQKYKFLNLARAEKLKVSKEQMNKMKNSTIKDLLENVKISKKYKQYNEDTNKKNLDALIKEPWFQQIFDMKFLDLFVYYYNNEQPLKEITLFGRKVTFQTTESFSDLLQNNKNIEDKMVKFTKVIYFDDEINSSETV